MNNTVCSSFKNRHFKGMRKEHGGGAGERDGRNRLCPVHIMSPSYQPVTSDADGIVHFYLYIFNFSQQDEAFLIW